jgi:hypothetical protein
VVEASSTAPAPTAPEPAGPTKKRGKPPRAAAIGFGWSGVANKDCVECQMPYLLSAGATGIGLIVFGVGMMVMAQLRTEGRRLADRLEQWRSAALPREPSVGGPNGSVASPGEAAEQPSPVSGEPSPTPKDEDETETPPVANRAGPG